MSSTGHTQNPSPESTADNRATLEVERLHLEVEKLKLEVQAIRSPSFWERYISRIVPLITAAIAVGGFLWGINVHVAQQRENE
jgi:hypothetical protein